LFLATFNVRVVLFIIALYYSYLTFSHAYSHQTSASARISKGHGYQGLLRKKAGRSFGKKLAFCIVARKNVKKLEKLIEFHSF
jgi:hypothetical protein